MSQHKDVGRTLGSAKSLSAQGWNGQPVGCGRNGSPRPDSRVRSLLVISADAARDRLRLRQNETPRRDYLELAVALDAVIVDAGQGLMASQLQRWPLARDAGVAVRAAARPGVYDVVFADNERIGIVLAGMLRLRKKPRLVVLGHHLSPPRKRPFLRFARSRIDTLVVHSDEQRKVALENLGFRPENVVTLPYQVDAAFWALPPVTREDMVCTAGLECRDYDSLITAAGGLGVQLRIGAASNWSGKRNALAGRPLPVWVQARPYSYCELRELYARSRFVVVPLMENSFQAGITTILEAMAAGRAVVTSKTRGQADAVHGPLWSEGDAGRPGDTHPIDEANGIFVRPGDAAGLRSAMRFLLDHPDLCDRLGDNGRRDVLKHYTVELFAQRFAEVIGGPGMAAEASPADEMRSPVAAQQRGVV